MKNNRMVIINNLKGYKEIMELISSELDDYSYFEYGKLEWNNGYGEYDKEDEDEHYEIEIKDTTQLDYNKTKTLSFNYNKKDDKIEVELGEDNFHETDSYSHKVKYFWMALLWD